MFNWICIWAQWKVCMSKKGLQTCYKYLLKWSLHGPFHKDGLCPQQRYKCYIHIKAEARVFFLCPTDSDSIFIFFLGNVNKPILILFQIWSRTISCVNLDLDSSFPVHDKAAAVRIVRGSFFVHIAFCHQWVVGTSQSG